MEITIESVSKMDGFALSELYDEIICEHDRWLKSTKDSTEFENIQKLNLFIECGDKLEMLDDEMQKRLEYYDKHRGCKCQSVK